MKKLGVVAAVVFAGTLAVGCARNEPNLKSPSLNDGNHVDAAQDLTKFNQAIEFTPKTDPSMQCVTIASHSGNSTPGGVYCWKKSEKLPSYDGNQGFAPR